MYTYISKWAASIFKRKFWDAVGSDVWGLVFLRVELTGQVSFFGYNSCTWGRHRNIGHIRDHLKTSGNFSADGNQTPSSTFPRNFTAPIDEARFETCVYKVLENFIAQLLYEFLKFNRINESLGPVYNKENQTSPPLRPTLVHEILMSTDRAPFETSEY